MTPDSILKAMAEALAKKYTSGGSYRGELEKYNKSLEERLDQGMMDHYTADDGYRSMAPVTPREAAVEAMTVVGPILELFFRLAETARELAKSHKEFIEDSSQPDAHTLEVQYVMESLLGQIEVKEPADWNYVSRFSATPSEIHDILRSGLHPKVYLAYQQALARPILRQAAEEVLRKGEEGLPAEERLFSPEHAAMFEMVRRSADLINPDSSGPTLPNEVVTPEG